LDLDIDVLTNQVSNELAAAASSPPVSPSDVENLNQILGNGDAGSFCVIQIVLAV
jgi:hypothetical protein